MNKLEETIKDFHNTDKRYKKLIAPHMKKIEKSEVE